MKRDSWTPSKHQLLCSDHFTPDSLDVRWGIRYLKNTAVPTIFSSPDDEEKDSSESSSQQVQREERAETNVSEKVSVPLEPCIPKKNPVIAQNVEEKVFFSEVGCSTALSKPLQIQNLQLPDEGGFQADSVILDSSSEQYIHQPNPVLMTTAVQSMEGTSVQTSVEDSGGCTATVLQFTDPDYLSSSLKLNNAFGLVTDYAVENSVPHVVCSAEVQTSEDAVLLSTVTQTIEQFSGSEESVIAIIMPAESPEEPERVSSSFLPVKEEFLDIDKTEVNEYDGNEILQTEHSYCRQDIGRDHLWQKISKLHSKITLLEMQEVKTLGRLRSLEAFIRQLKQENLLSEEKLKMVENYFTTLEVTMLQ
ncbi:THAP domain-containing protein 5 isoform X3 [Cyanistes caeruleus]|nr:THAP domain-containing protein 5 isoform X3 [Cyanistes caeruleus]XP_023786279.1 THAP domain-containing protein 5 isoform X3 [Cyanistes caeruleus]XP_023786290.1 THAP domain-containing protein 5 isoform X3 [Cyanistes caeruleus]XP_023786301.1 THAP domain-containing protein 5 isoform X3 [Cyanistes caeruleus]XP_023786311.1 THAP domain-containing protein 5 isoform X3 [Cyanistes caeruleus]